MEGSDLWIPPDLANIFISLRKQRKRTNSLQNMVKDPRISFRIGDRDSKGIGRIVNELEERELWRTIRSLSEQKYGIKRRPHRCDYAGKTIRRVEF
jgi:hypothetical protein